MMTNVLIVEPDKNMKKGLYLGVRL